MTWTYNYDNDKDETTIRYDGEDLGKIEGRLNSFRGGIPTGEARKIIKEAVDDPMIVDLLIGFSETDE